MFDTDKHDSLLVATLVQNHKCLQEGTMSLTEYVQVAGCLGYHCESVDCIILESYFSEGHGPFDTCTNPDNPITRKEATIDLANMDSNFIPETIFANDPRVINRETVVLPS